MGGSNLGHTHFFHPLADLSMQGMGALGQDKKLPDLAPYTFSIRSILDLYFFTLIHKIGLKVLIRPLYIEIISVQQAHS